MKITEAIKTLTDWGVISEPQVDQDLLDAVKLGVEGLKLLQHQRTYLKRAQDTILPGETIDD